MLVDALCVHSDSMVLKAWCSLGGDWNYGGLERLCRIQMMGHHAPLAYDGLWGRRRFEKGLIPPCSKRRHQTVVPRELLVTKNCTS